MGYFSYYTPQKLTARPWKVVAKRKKPFPFWGSQDLGPQTLSDITRDPGPQISPSPRSWSAILGASFHGRTAGEKTKENRTKVSKRKGTISKEPGLTSSNFQPIQVFLVLDISPVGVFWVWKKMKKTCLLAWPVFPLVFLKALLWNQALLLRKLTCTLKINGWKMYSPLKQSFFRGHVSFLGCISKVGYASGEVGWLDI